MLQFVVSSSCQIAFFTASASVQTVCGRCVNKWIARLAEMIVIFVRRSSNCYQRSRIYITFTFFVATLAKTQFFWSTNIEALLPKEFCKFLLFTDKRISVKRAATDQYLDKCTYLLSRLYRFLDSIGSNSATSTGVDDLVFSGGIFKGIMVFG